MARKSMYSPEMHKSIVDALSTGVSIHDVCAYVGISQETYFAWCRQKAQFLQDTTRARVSGRIGAAAVVRKSALSGNPEDAKWYLERTDPGTWGRKDMLIALGLDGKLLKELKQKADNAGVDLASVFEAMINEFAHVEPDSDSAE